VSLSRATKNTFLHKYARALVTSIVFEGRVTSHVRKVIVTGVASVRDSKTLAYIRTSRAVKVLVGVGHRNTSLLKRASALRIPLTRVTKTLSLKKIGKALVTPIVSIAKLVNRPRRASVVQVASATVIKRKIILRNVQVTTVQVVGSSKARGYLRFATAAAIAIGKTTISSAVYHIRRVLDTPETTPVDTSNNYVLPSDLDSEDNPTIINDGLPVDYNEEYDGEGDATIPNPN
jgi:hypothetical protein